MKHIKRTLSVLIALALIVTMFIVPVHADAAANTLTGKNNLSTYAFTGEDAARSGYAEGTVTIQTSANRKYYAYWADATGIRSDFEELASFTATSTSYSFSFARNVAIPKGVTSIAIFQGNLSTALSSAYDIIEIPTSKQLTDPAVFTFGSVSDIHVNYDSEGQNATGKWTNALNFYADEGVDYIILSGDMTSNATTSEFESYKRATQASRYDASRIYEARGNHESQGNANWLSYTSGGEAAGEIRPTANSPWFYKIFPGVNGAKDNMFIFMAQELSSTGNSSNQNNWSTEQLNWVENLLKTYSGTNTNIYIVQHTVFKHWGPGDTYAGLYVQPTYVTATYPNNLRLKNLLQEYKEVIMMSGHTHLSFYEGYNFSDENGTAARMIHNSSTSQPRIIKGNALDYGNATETYGSEGYVVNVTNNDIIYYGRNFSTSKYIPSVCFIMKSYSEDRNAKSIAVTKAPTKTTYDAGETFDQTGMEVTATYANGSKAVVKGYFVDTDTALTNGTKSVTVRFGDVTTTVPVTVGKVAADFEGDGTYQSPYLIKNADDFNKFTELFNKSEGSGSHDNTTYGAGLYFKQTADIDMTGYAGYKGTAATGDAKYGFSGIYDGDGHTLTVNITSGTFETSVFPYLNGLIMNLNVDGSITSTYTNSSNQGSVQFVRTIGQNGAVINCTCSLDLTAERARGLTLTLYGYTDHFVYTGKMSYSNASYTDPITANVSNGTLTNATFFATNASGGAMTSKYASAGTTQAAAVETMNSASTATALTKAKVYNASIKADDINTWELNNGIARVKVNTTIIPPEEGQDFAGKGTYESPYLIQTAADFNKFTERFNASVGSGSHDNTTYGAGLYFKQTADIDMTGYAGYKGTSATGDAKYGFSGIYDGDGHTLTVNITSGTFETSVFPYVNGLIMNLNVDGSITSTYTNSSNQGSVQFVRTIGQNGAVINCTCSLDLTAERARGLTLTLYGYTDHFVYTGKMSYSNASYTDPITANVSNGTLTNSTFFATNASGGAMTSKYVSAGTTQAAAVDTMNNASTATALTKAKAYNSSITADDINTWELVSNIARVKAGAAVVPPEEDKDFAGDGTAESPYLIQTADDFNKLTELFNAKVGTGSHDNTTYGAGYYFKQTADIDMTGYAGYKGTAATGDAKYGFSGIYDGDGHTLTVNITSDAFETSVFPYLNGMIINLNVKGSITSTSTNSQTSVQLIRTVGQYGSVINCTSSLTLSAKRVRGLTLTLYGYADRFVYNGKIVCPNASYTYPITGTISNSGVTGSYEKAYYSAVNSSNAAITGATYGTQYTDPIAVIKEFNNGVNSKTITRLATKNLTADSLVSWSFDDVMPRADGKEFVAPTSSFKTDASDYIVNEDITFTAVVPADVTDVALVNETGRYIVKKSASYVASEDMFGYNVWTIVASIGTCGEREISLYVKTGDGEFTDSELSTSFNVFRYASEGTDVLAVKAARAPETVARNEAFTLTVKTTGTATNIGIFDAATGKTLGKISQSYVDKNGDRSWTISTKIGSKGSRSFIIRCSDNFGNWSELDASKTINIGVA